MRGVVSGLPVLSCVLVGLFAVVNCGGSDSNGGGSPDPEAGAGGETAATGGTSGKGGSGGKGGSAGKGGSSGRGGAGGKGGSGGSTAGGEGGTPPEEGGAPGMGGEAGAPGPGVVSQAGPRTGFAIVAAGALTHSDNFTLLATLGEEPGGNRSMSSESHRLNLGFVGSTQ